MVINGSSEPSIFYISYCNCYCYQLIFWWTLGGALVKVGSTPALQTYGRPIAQDLGNNHWYKRLMISCYNKNFLTCLKVAKTCYIKLRKIYYITRGFFYTPAAQQKRANNFEITSPRSSTSGWNFRNGKIILRWKVHW